MPSMPCAPSLLLGILLHASESFMTDNRAWAIIDRSTGLAPAIGVYVIHIFRMALFFLMAGFFSRLIVERRGLEGFVRDRLKRILGPLVLGWCAVYPFIVWAWIWGAQRSGGRDLPAWILTIGAFVTGEVFRDGVSLGHLWFLYYLLLCYLAVIAVRWVFRRLDVGARAAAHVDRAFGAVLRSPGRAVLAAPVCVALWWGEGWLGVNTPDRSLVPDPAVVLAYSTFVGLGWLLHRQPVLLEMFRQRWHASLVEAIVLTIALLGAVDFVSKAQQAGWRAAYVGVYAVAMWSWVFGLVGLALDRLSAPNPAVRYVADASYWPYIVHLPLVVFLQVGIARLAVHWSVKLPAVLAIAMPVLLASYHLLVRFTWIGELLNGRKHVRIAAAAAPQNA